MRVAFRDLAETGARPTRRGCATASILPDASAALHRQHPRWRGGELSRPPACARARTSPSSTTTAGRASRYADPAPELDHHRPLRPRDWRAARLHARDLSLRLPRRRDQRAGGLGDRRARTPAVLGLFGTGQQALPGCRAICAVRPIKRVQVFSPNPAHRQAFVEAHGGEKRRGRCGRRSARGRARRARASAARPIRKTPVLRRRLARSPARWSSPSPIPMCSIRAARSTRRPSRARARSSSTTGTASVANRQVELAGADRKGLVQARDCARRSATSSPARRRCAAIRSAIVYYKNNTGLAMQFAACGAIVHRKLAAEGTNAHHSA